MAAPDPDSLPVDRSEVVETYLTSTQGRQRIDRLAREYHRNHRISLPQCRQIALADVRRWANSGIGVIATNDTDNHHA